MTLRLVAVMSVVLLLSLASFGLLVNHYQDQVMQEVARTASAVGQATLRTFEFGPHDDLHVETKGDGTGVFVWQSGPLESTDLQFAAPGEPRAEKIGDREFSRVIAHFKDKIAEHDAEMVGRRRVVEGAMVVRCEIKDGEEECVTSQGPAVLGTDEQAFIRIEDVRAESDPSRGIVLTIPRVTRVPAAENHFVAAGTGAPADAVIEASLEEIRVPIPDEKYRQLFDTLRDRSLFLFLGVFIVGTALSAGLATRLTRPIRKLDAGIRRLSEGDLDAEVAVRGKDEIARLGSAFNDMTRKLRANRERSRELTRREKLSALGRLAAGVAHDVRNPLHSIGLTLQHLQETARPESDARAVEFDRSLDIIRGEIRRLDQLVTNFLGFATSDRGERSPVDLRELLHETARLVKKEAEWRKVRLELQIDQPVPDVLADGEALRSSILNLVLNSFEAMPEGGVLRMALGVDGNEVVVEVADDGSGIQPADRDRVFDFAFTTREGGSGLGLAMVHQCIVEEHGGRVTLDSAPGRGTTIRLALHPAAGDEERPN